MSGAGDSETPSVSAVFRRFVVLDEHHGHVVAFLRVGHVEKRLPSGFEPDRLVVEYPVRDVVVALLDQEIRRFPGLGKPGAEPQYVRL
jgi:hypothetical protein